MTEIVEFLRVLVVLSAGLLLRAFALVLVLAVWAIPAFVILGIWRAWAALRARRLGLAPVDGLVLADAFHYSPSHSWLSKGTGSRLKIGLDALGARLFHQMERIELPYPGTVLKAGDAAVRVVAGGRQAILIAPVDGTVTKVNRALGRRPELLASAPYGEGWLYSMKPASKSWESLPIRSAARRWFQAEERRLATFLEGELELSAADGGELLVPAPALLSEERWRHLVDKFLR